MYAFLFYSVLVFSTTVIAVQDFKARAVALWALLLYVVNIAVFTYIKFGAAQLLENLCFVVVYFGICLTVVFLFYFAKEGKVPQIVDSKIGKADLLIFLGIGAALPPFTLVLFFTVAFVLALLITLFVIRDKKQVPLAGLLVIIYILFDIFSSVTSSPTWS